MEKTKYEFKCDKDIALNIINSFLQANNYKQRTSEQGRIYYEFSDAVVIGFLEYEINDEMTTIYAYLRSEKKPMPLDNSFVGILLKNHYKSIIEPLLKSLANPNASVINIQNGEFNDKQEKVINNDVSKNESVENNAYNQFAEENDKSKAKFSTIAFVIAIVGLLLSFVGVTFGLIIVLLEYAFAIQGLKSSKRNLSIATIVLASITLLINISTLISAM